MKEAILKGKTAVITGGAKGIGEETAIRFAEEGANLVLFDLDSSRLVSTKDECQALGAKVLTFTVDICDVVAVTAASEKAIDEFGGVDIIVNNAGVWEKKQSELINPLLPPTFLNVTNDCWKRMIDINIMGCVNVIRAFLPGMIEKKNGKIVNLGSVAGINGIPTMSEYSATKGAVIAMTKALAHELAAHHINVNAVSPGSVSTEGRAAPASYLGISSPRDMANTILFLASPESDFITGQNIAVDGGRTLSLKCD